jgi:hypothetical protein
MGEHLLCKQGVIGSIPFTSTNQKSEDSSQNTEKAGGWGWRGKRGNSEKVEQKVPGGCGGLCSGLFGQKQDRLFFNN